MCATVGTHPLAPHFNRLHAAMASCLTCSGNGAMPTAISSATVAVVLTDRQVYIAD